MIGYKSTFSILAFVLTLMLTGCSSLPANNSLDEVQTLVMAQTDSQLKLQEKKLIRL